MKNQALRALLIVLIGVFVTIGCATVPTEVPEDLSPAELLQRAQEFADSRNYQAALAYNQAIMDRFPEDRVSYITAQYHRGLFHQRNGDFEIAIEQYEIILARFQAETNLPNWIRILSERRLEDARQGIR
jgi:outer membrane protein assembly factor BamD (BamD/ComL family)